MTFVYIMSTCIHLYMIVIYKIAYVTSVFPAFV